MDEALQILEMVLTVIIFAAFLDGMLWFFHVGKCQHCDCIQDPASDQTALRCPRCRRVSSH